MREFIALLDEDTSRARERALRAVQRTRHLPSRDTRRGDALEQLLMVQVRLQEWQGTLPLAEELLDSRRSLGQPDLLALALSNWAIVLMADGRAEGADAALHESLTCWRQALAPDSLALAEKLETFAQWGQKSFGRSEYVIELLREAVDIRRAHPLEQALRLATILQELALHEMPALLEDEAWGHQVEALQLLRAALPSTPAGAAHQELLAGIVQCEVALAGLHLARGDVDAARARLEGAAAEPLTDAPLRAEAAGLIAQVTSWICELNDDLDGAIAAGWLVMDAFDRQATAAGDAGGPDPRIPGDIALVLAGLYLKAQQPELARDALALAQTVHGASAELLLLRAQVLGQSGDPAAALDCYRQGLTLRKESATETLVLFGTPRCRVTAGRRLARDETVRPEAFSHELGEPLHCGRADVLVPGGVLAQEVWLPAWHRSALPLGRATRVDALHLRAMRVQGAVAWARQARRIERSAKLHAGAALVFVHGFNVSLEGALKRGAQLKRDLNFDGPLFVFSWPSRGSPLRYFKDRSSALASVDALVAFLLAVEGACAATRIHVLAHSMGNRVLLPALARAVSRPTSGLRERLGEVIFAAPAVPTSEFVPAIEQLAGLGLRRMTLYASRSDLAMSIGLLAEGAVLAGHTADREPLVHPALHSIDITQAGSPELLALNHDVFTANPVMNEDLRQLLQHGSERAPHERLGELVQVRSLHHRGCYWRFRADAVITRLTEDGP